MEFLAAGLCLQNRKCLVAGTTAPALTMLDKLAECGAHVTLVAPETRENLPASTIQLRRQFRADDLRGCWLAVAASHDEQENAQVQEACEQRRIFCYAPAGGSSSFTPQDSAAATVPDGSTPATQPQPATTAAGQVSLVGAGPGDPDLLTIRALSTIRNADVVVYDRLVSEPVLALCSANTKLIYAGKAKSRHTLPQESINRLLVDLASQYRHVVRLKGGDPFIFGRGGEEIETLAERQVKFQVVPGITAAAGCAAFAGIPLTHRDHAQSCVFVTGHLQDGKINLNWGELVDPTQTVVVYMGLTGLATICASLMENGRDPDTPAALIEQGTTPAQRVFSSTLRRLPAVIERSSVVAPTLLIIGGVVNLRSKLQWFD